MQAWVQFGAWLILVAAVGNFVLAVVRLILEPTKHWEQHKSYWSSTDRSYKQ